MNQTTCRRNCASTQWWKSSDNTCQPCHSSCLTCKTGANTSNCLSCRPNFYLDVLSSPEGRCLQCDAVCGGLCTGPIHTKCTAPSCATSFLKDGTVCKRQCPDGQYASLTDNTCQPCHLTCKTCTNGNTKSNCLSCSLDNNYDPKTGSTEERICPDCDESCGRKCFGPSYKECNADDPCTQGYAILDTEC